MKKLFPTQFSWVVIAWISTLLIAMAFTPVAHAKSRTFSYPKVNGYYVDRCLTWGKQCNWPAAHKFCKKRGYQHATAWKWKYMKPTRTMGSGQVCNLAGSRGCGGFSSVTCGMNVSGQLQEGGEIQPLRQRRKGRPCSECPNSVCLLGVCAN